MRLTLFCASLAVLVPRATLGQPAIEGLVEPTNVSLATIALDRLGVVWRTERSIDKHSTFFRLHFADIAASPGANFLVRIRNRAHQPVTEIPASAFAKTNEYWSAYLSGTYALIEIDNQHADPNTHLSLRLAAIAIERRGARVLSFQDQNNPKDLPIAHYDDNPGVTAVARSVAKLRFRKEKLLLSCTGFLVAADLLLTNQHCFDTAASCATAIAQFGYQADRDRNLSHGEDYRCEAIKDTDEGLDFTLIKLEGSPGARWGVPKWDRTAPISGTAIYIVQHPGGEPKRVALDGCVVKTASAVGAFAEQQTDFGHLCDTGEGSSGAPVFDMNNHVIGLHHLGFSLNDPTWVKENRAVKSARIRDRISAFIP
jgi:V8-like Glu-specific endopeptidase